MRTWTLAFGRLWNRLRHFLHLTDRFISTPSRARHLALGPPIPNPSDNYCLNPGPFFPPPLPHLLCLLTLTPPLRLPKSLRRDLIQPIVLDAQFAATRPKVAAVTHEADVERVRSVASTHKSICCSLEV